MNKLISIFIICLLFVSNSFACDCALPSDNLKDNWEGAYQIFVGEVLQSSTNELYSASGLNYTYYTIQVIEPLKGSFHPKYRLRTFEKISHGSCEYTFDVGSKYLIYAYYENGKLSAHICSRTAPLEDVNENEITELKRLSTVSGIEKPVASITMSMAERELKAAKSKINELNEAREELSNTKNWLLGISLTLALLLLVSVFIIINRKRDEVQKGPSFRL